MRILIADDHEIIRRGVIAILQPHEGWKICGEALDGADAVEKAKDLRPDVVLLDISMPRLNGLEAARLIRQESGQVRIVIMSHDDAGLLLPIALAAGANGCVGKDRLSTDLIAVVQALEGHP